MGQLHTVRLTGPVVKVLEGVMAQAAPADITDAVHVGRAR
jgi:hypothetical protein